jgi:hypothetical protein
MRTRPDAEIGLPAFWIDLQAPVERPFQMVATGTEPAKVLRAHQAQLLLAAGNPEAEAAPVWRRVSA